MRIGPGARFVRRGVDVVQIEDGGGLGGVERRDRVPVMREAEVKQPGEEQTGHEASGQQPPPEGSGAEHPSEDQVPHEPPEEADIHRGNQGGKEPVRYDPLGGRRVQQQSVCGRFGDGNRNQEPHPAPGGGPGRDVVGNPALPAEAGEFLRGGLRVEVPGFDALTGGLNVGEGEGAVPFAGSPGLDPDGPGPRLALRRA